MEDEIKELSYYENSEGNLDKLDSVVTSVIGQFAQRSAMGKKKYGTDLDRKDLTTLDWIEHAKQELMDGILYLEKLKQELSVKK
jgi:hypothetical protein